MAIPSEKSPGTNAFLSSIAGKDREATIKADKCMTCSGPAIEFRNQLSKREYTISGMCQVCQDSVFGTDEEEQE